MSHFDASFPQSLNKIHNQIENELSTETQHSQTESNQTDPSTKLRMGCCSKTYYAKDVSTTPCSTTTDQPTLSVCRAPVANSKKSQRLDLDLQHTTIIIDAEEDRAASDSSEYVVFNFAWSFLYNFFAVGLAAGIFSSRGDVRIPPQ